MTRARFQDVFNIQKDGASVKRETVRKYVVKCPEGDLLNIAKYSDTLIS